MVVVEVAGCLVGVRRVVLGERLSVSGGSELGRLMGWWWWRSLGAWCGRGEWCWGGGVVCPEGLSWGG